MRLLEYPVILKFVRDFCVQQILFAPFTTAAMLTLTREHMLIQVLKDLTFLFGYYGTLQLKGLPFPQAGIILHSASLTD